MSWDPGEHCVTLPPNVVNSKWENVRGDLTIDEAQKWFMKFIASNPAIASELIIGPTKGKLRPIQDLLIRTWFKRDNNMLIAGRGFSKSYTAAMFIVLFALFFPGSKIGIFAPSFRQAKQIFYQIEEFRAQKDAFILQQCIDLRTIKHDTDAHFMKIGQSTVKAIPLTAKARGARFSLIIIDEYLTVSENMIKEVVKPMRVVKQGRVDEQKLIKRWEDAMIKEGKMKEWERTDFLGSKIIMLSSASYEIDTLYKETYLNIYNSIHPDEKELKRQKDAGEQISASLFRLGYKLAPEGQLEQSVINDALKTYSEHQFNREYNAIFTKESGSFFSHGHIVAATVPDGEEPVMTLKGRKDSEYILAIDPNSSAGSEDADNFAMAVLEVSNDGTERATLVHAYAMAASEVKQRATYLKYLLLNFNIKLIIVDNAGGPKFMEEFHALYGDFKIQPKIIEIDFDDPEKFRETRPLYQPEQGHMVISIPFNKRGFIREANEALQADLQNKRIMFASPIFQSDAHTESNMKSDLKVDIRELEFRKMDKEIQGDGKRMLFIETIEQVIENTKNELRVIEISVDSSGNYRFDVPRSLKNTSGKDRVRRDSYTALFLANWGRRLYFKLKNEDYEEVEDFPCCAIR